MKINKLKQSLYALFMIVLAPRVFAATYVPDAIQDFLEFIFIALPEEAQNTTTNFVIYFKFMLWILIFAVYYYSVKKVFSDHNRIAGTIAFVLSFGSVLLIPPEMLLFLFSNFSLLTSILLALTPIFFGLWLANKVHSKFVKGIILFLVALAAIIVGSYLLTLDTGSLSEFYNRAGGFILYGGILAMLIAFFTFRKRFWPDRTRYGRDRYHDDDYIDNDPRYSSARRKEQKHEKDEVEADIYIVRAITFLEKSSAQSHAILFTLLKNITILTENLKKQIAQGLTERDTNLITSQIKNWIANHILPNIEQHEKLNDIEKKQIERRILKPLKELKKIVEEEDHDEAKLIKVLEKLDRKHHTLFSKKEREEINNEKIFKKKEKLVAYLNRVEKQLEKVMNDEFERGNEYIEKHVKNAFEIAQGTADPSNPKAILHEIRRELIEAYNYGAREAKLVHYLAELEQQGKEVVKAIEDLKPSSP